MSVVLAPPRRGSTTKQRQGSDRGGRHRLAPVLLVGAYLLLAVLMTWPVAAGLSTDIPADLHDPLFNAWVLGWNATHQLRILGGDWTAYQELWHANIFYPEPLVLAYSEHLTAQAAQILPAYALTGNLVLCYNLLFLSSFVLSAFGAYLLVKELTGSRGAAFVAGLIYGFLPYRFEQLPHLQVLSSQWMPFALLGMRRYFETRRRLPLALAVVALILQNLSCGYYVFFFAPLIGAYALYETATRSLWRDWRHWRALLVAGLVVCAATLPFLLPYLELRARGAIYRERVEIDVFSADLLAYVTASERARLWGPLLQTFPAPEGSLFLGLVPVVLATLAVSSLARRARTRVRQSSGSRRRRLGELLKATFGTVVGFYLLAMLGAMALSLGPTIRLAGEPLANGPYLWLYEHVPGFDGLRVPARFAMVAGLSLAVLAGFGVVTLLETRKRRGAWIAGLSLIFLLEATATPLPMNVVPWDGSAFSKLPRQVDVGPEPPGIYRAVAALPHDAILVELPVGSIGYEIRYTYNSTFHWRRLINGYSGALPVSYTSNVRALSRALWAPAVAWRGLRASGASHVIVHQGAWRISSKGERLCQWLEAHGAERLATVGRDVLFRLPATNSSYPDGRHR